MTVAVDTSVAVPLLVRSHQHHADVVRWWGGQELTLSGHALPETYCVLTKIAQATPGSPRTDAARLLDDAVQRRRPDAGRLERPGRSHATLSGLGVAGGAV